MTKNERAKADAQTESASEGRSEAITSAHEKSETGGLRQVTMTTAAGTHQATRNYGTTEDPYLEATVDNRYVVEARLGEGGMGVVYRCRHTIIGKLVAMKVLRADLARNEEVTERFLNEARSASSIGNPHIIDISDFGRLPDGATYFVMEYLEGTPLADILESQEPLELGRAARIALQLAEGLSAAHEAGIVHRDLKPDNIFLVQRGSHEDFVKILDFGIAKASTTGSKLTQAGQVFGTPHYMSPEQASGSDVDHRSDIYALGVILYEMVSGTVPFDADNFMGILSQHMYRDPIPPSQRKGADISPELEAVILRCLEKNPDNRYQTIAELERALQGLFGDLRRGSSHEIPHPQMARASQTLESTTLPRKKSHLGPILLVALACVAVGAAGVMGWSTVVEESETSETEALVAEGDVTRGSAEDQHELAATEERAPTEDGKPKEPSLHRVAIAVAPLTARVFEGKKDLGTSPVMLEVGEEPVTLTIKAEGYREKTIEVDGSQSKLSVDLEKIPAPKAPRPQPRRSPKAAQPAPKPKPAPKPSIGGEELLDPWD